MTVTSFSAVTSFRKPKQPRHCRFRAIGSDQRGWQCGQWNVERWPIRVWRIEWPQTRHGRPARP
jgi:hypothetical protein